MRTDSPSLPLSEIITNALRYWEYKRIWFNIILILLALGCFLFSRSPALGLGPFFKSFPLLFLFLFKANIAFCLCYLADVFIQLSEFRSLWLRRRFWLYALILINASIISFHQIWAIALINHMRHEPLLRHLQTPSF